jgi:hypothetical protein
MRKPVALAFAASLLGLSAALPARAQDMGASIEVGTLGLRAQFAVSLNEQVVVRTGAAFEPFPIHVEASDITYDLDLPNPSLSALLDWHPGGHGFRFSGGAVYFTNELELEGTPNQPVEIGDDEYAPSELGTLIGNLGTARFAPYVGIGLGNATRLGTRFVLDLGVALHGTPDVQLRATGPIKDDPTFQADLEQELQDVTDDIKSFKVYPVLSLGVGFGI